MLRVRASRLDQRGMVLFICLTLLSVLTALAMGALVAVQNDFKITSGLKTATAAFYLADSGVEWAKQQIGRSATNPLVVRNASQSVFNGSFSVSFSSPTKLSPLTGEIDVRSIGRAGGTTQVINARVSKTYHLADAALGVRGAARVDFAGEAFVISGQDHDPFSGTLTGMRKHGPAISVSAPSVALDIVRQLQAAQTSNLVRAQAAPGVVQSDRLPASMLQRLADDLCSSPDSHKTAVPVTGLILAGQTWGNHAAPQLRCLKGPSTSGTVVTIGAGVSGAGILVVNDAALAVVGSFHWEGLVIVSGARIGFAVAGEENKEVLGALLVNETASASAASPPTFDLHGAARILYSSAALAAVSNLIPPSVLAASYGALPYTVRPTYWKSISH